MHHLYRYETVFHKAVSLEEFLLFRTEYLLPVQRDRNGSRGGYSELGKVLRCAAIPILEYARMQN